MDDSEDNLSAEEIKFLDSPSLVRGKPKKRSLIERELETSLTARVTSPITNEESSNKSRYGRARRLKTDVDTNDCERSSTKHLKSPKLEKSPIRKQSPVYKMHASNSPLRMETPKQSNTIEHKLDSQIESIYNENMSLSRFGSEEKKNVSPAKKFPKVYIRQDLIQSKEKDKEETVTLIKNMFSPVKLENPGTHLELSSEKYEGKPNGYMDTLSVVKTLDFDSNKKKKRDVKEGKVSLSKSDIFNMEAKCEYQVGDLAWARMGTYPFWPCIITRDPVSKCFVKKKLFGRIERDVLHVTFFGDNGRRGWIVDNMLRKFLGQLEFETTREQFSSEAKKRDPRLYAAFFISEKKLSQWKISVEEAEVLLREPKRLRIDALREMLEKSKSFKTTPKTEKSQKVTRTNSDVSLSESLYDTLFSEDDSKSNDNHSERSRSKTRNKSFDVSEVVTACLDNMAAKTGITKIQRQSHMDRWLQKAKAKTPEKSLLKSQVTLNTDKELKSNNVKLVKSSSNETQPKKSLRLKKIKIESQDEIDNKLLSHQNEHDYSKITVGNEQDYRDSTKSPIVVLNKIDHSQLDNVNENVNIEELSSGIDIAKVESLCGKIGEDNKVNEHHMLLTVVNEEFVVTEPENKQENDVTHDDSHAISTKLYEGLALESRNLLSKDNFNDQIIFSEITDNRNVDKSEVNVENESDLRELLTTNNTIDDELSKNDSLAKMKECYNVDIQVNKCNLRESSVKEVLQKIRVIADFEDGRGVNNVEDNCRQNENLDSESVHTSEIKVTKEIHDTSSENDKLLRRELEEKESTFCKISESEKKFAIMRETNKNGYDQTLKQVMSDNNVENIIKPDLVGERHDELDKEIIETNNDNDCMSIPDEDYHTTTSTDHNKTIEIRNDDDEYSINAKISLTDVIVKTKTLIESSNDTNCNVPGEQCDTNLVCKLDKETVNKNDIITNSEVPMEDNLSKFEVLCLPVELKNNNPNKDECEESANDIKNNASFDNLVQCVELSNDCTTGSENKVTKCGMSINVDENSQNSMSDNIEEVPLSNVMSNITDGDQKRTYEETLDNNKHNIYNFNGNNSIENDNKDESADVSSKNVDVDGESINTDNNEISSSNDPQSEIDPDYEVNIVNSVNKTDVISDSMSMNSESSEASESKQKLRAKFDRREKKFVKKELEDPEFLKYLELRQDAIIDENPQLSQEEITHYLYKTWLYEESVKSDSKKTDDIEQATLVKGLNPEPIPTKKIRKKSKVIKNIVESEEIIPKSKSKRNIVKQCYNEDYYDVETEMKFFQIFNKKSNEKNNESLNSMKLDNNYEPLEKNLNDNPLQENGDDFEPLTGDEFDQVEEYFQQLTRAKPNLFKGLLREKVCEICEKTGNLAKCKGCHCMFHIDCTKKENGEVIETQLPSRGRRKKKKNRGRKQKTSEDPNGVDQGSQSDKSQDANGSEENLNISMDDVDQESHIVVDADDLEAQLSAKMKEMCDTLEHNYITDSSENELDWSDTEAGKCKIIDIKLPSKNRNSDIADSDFKCNNCLLYDVPVCCVCKCAKSPRDCVEYRQKCHVAHCNRYYHLECLEHWPQTQFHSGEASNNQTKIRGYFEPMTCPRHVCHTCVSDDPRGCKTRFSGDKLARCIRCPATYHTFTKCVPAGTQILTGSHIICPRHYQHRPGKVPCHVNTGWCFICALGGSLICCEYCPTSFHAECLNIKPPEGGYMCEDCETGRLPLYGEMVWVKLGHYRWWPGIILHPSEIPANIMAVKHSPGEFVVRFFGQYDHYWVNRGRVFPFQEGDSGKVSSQKSKIDAAFSMAMDHAKRACEILKNAAPNDEESLDIASSLLPPHYVKLRANKPCGSLCGRRADVGESSLTQCECSPDEEDPCGPYSQCLNRMLLTECGPSCRAGERCNNRAFERRLYPKLVPYRTPHRGWGLKTLEDIRAGQFVIEYVGELIDEEEFKRRMIRKHEIRDENYYFLTLDKERMIDAGPKGNLARFMNHCCEPNCETQKWTVLGDVRVGLFALRDIPANSEVTFNYNLQCAGIEKKSCLCGAKRCSGYIGAKPKQLQNDPQPKKNRKELPAKRPYKKRKNVELSPTIRNKTVKRRTDRSKPRELTEIEKDLLIIKNATNGMSSDSECSGRLSIDSNKEMRTLKRRRVEFSTEVISNGTSTPGAKKFKMDEKIEAGD